MIFQCLHVPFFLLVLLVWLYKLYRSLRKAFAASLSSHPWRYDDGLEAVKDGFDGDGGVHTAEGHDRVGDGRRAVVERLDDQSETWTEGNWLRLSVRGKVFVVLVAWVFIYDAVSK